MTPAALTRELLVEAAIFHRVSVLDVLSARRGRQVSLARWRAMWRIRNIQNASGKPRYSFPRIARMVGVKNHTSVMHGVRKYAVHLKDAGVDNAIIADEWAVDIPTTPSSYPHSSVGLRPMKGEVEVECLP